MIDCLREFWFTFVCLYLLSVGVLVLCRVVWQLAFWGVAFSGNFVAWSVFSLLVLSLVFWLVAGFFAYLLDREVKEVKALNWRVLLWPVCLLFGHEPKDVNYSSDGRVLVSVCCRCGCDIFLDVFTLGTEDEEGD